MTSAYRLNLSPDVYFYFFLFSFSDNCIVNVWSGLSVHIYTYNMKTQS